MRYIRIDMAKPGMQLARLILDSNNRILLGTRNPLTQEQIDKIKERGFAGIYIEDELSKDIIIEETISEELKNLGIKALRERNIDASLDVARKIVEQILSSESISLDLIDLRTYDDYTYRHSINVCVIATVIGINLKMKSLELVKLGTAAILHDMGKLMIDPAILNKPSKLTPEEYQIVREHPRLSYNLLQDRTDISETTKLGVLHHHENEDGSGYPTGLERECIPLFSKIIHVCDVYDALTSKRPYKKPYAISEAIEYLMGGCDILFDRSIVDVFLNFVPVYPKGTMVKMSDGRPALIVRNTSNPLRPVIRFEDGTDVNLKDDVWYQNLTICPSAEVETDFGNLCGENAGMKQRLKILLIDNDVISLNRLKNLLEKEYQITMLKSGEKALEYLKTKPLPDLIIIDIDLPHIDGIETVRRIRAEISEQIPVVFLTAISDRDTVLKCKSVQAKDYIIKPFQPVYAQERIRIAIGERGSLH